MQMERDQESKWSLGKSLGVYKIKAGTGKGATGTPVAGAGCEEENFQAKQNRDRTVVRVVEGVLAQWPGASSSFVVSVIGVRPRLSWRSDGGVIFVGACAHLLKHEHLLDGYQELRIGFLPCPACSPPSPD